METIEIAPNQLQLFDMLTAPQLERLEAIKQSAEREMLKTEAYMVNTVAFLTKCGFTDRHFEHKMERKRITRKVNVNHWNEPEVRVDVELDTLDRYCYLLYSRYSPQKNEINTVKTSFILSKNKIEACSLTGNYRAYKPESILTKIEESYEIASNQYDRANLVMTNTENAVTKYQMLYPDAEVKAGKGYTSGTYKEYSKVSITFKSGSYVELEIGSTPDQERLINRYDAVFKKMSINEMMDYFNAQ